MDLNKIAATLPQTPLNLNTLPLEKIWFRFEVQMKAVPKGQIGNKSALFRVIESMVT